jgi:hypothetical protein
MLMRQSKRTNCVKSQLSNAIIHYYKINNNQYKNEDIPKNFKIMKEKFSYLSRMLMGLGLIAISALLVTSCAEGFDDDETFGGYVKNAQLESPVLDANSFGSQIGSDGLDYVLVSWKIVYGASGYECEVQNVDDPSNPVEIMKDTIDGTNFRFKKADDTNYKVSVRTLGNAKYNNKDASAATDYAYSTLVPAQVIPAGTEISAFVKSHLLDTDSEQAFELEAGASYDLSDEVDFKDKLVTLRGNKINHAIVTLGENGVMRTANGLKVKFINFDCTAATNDGIVECSSQPYSAAKSFKNNTYILENPIILQNCMFKNVKSCLFFTGKCAWGVNDFRIDNCIVQLDNDGNKFANGAVICTYSSTSLYEGAASWNGIVRNITIKNSTIYNIKDNAKNRMIRFLSNNPSRIYSTADGSASISNCTISKVMSQKEFANNTPNTADYAITFMNNVCYDVFRLQKFIQGNNMKSPNYSVDPAKNTTWGVSNAVDATDKTRCATEEDPGFDATGVLKPLDLTQPNGGVNFKAHGTISSTIGDPRWLSAN